MTTRTKSQSTTKEAQRRAKAQAEAAAAQRQRRSRIIKWVAAGVTLTVVLGGLYAIFRAETESATTAAAPGAYEVGSPGPGQDAPDFTLPSATGQEITLSDFRGKTVLLYFHEGLGCQPCWDQIRDLEAEADRLDAAGIDEFVSITSAPTDLLAQKMRDDGLQSLALSDPGLDVIRNYAANQYGMMGDSRAGHSFVLVNADGQIVWRADYGGAPDYTMYIPVDKLLADLAAGRIEA